MAAPTTTGISPATGAATGGVTITLTGTGYSAGGNTTTGVTVNGAPVRSFTVASDTSITAVTPNAVAGLATVTVLNSAGNVSDSTHFTVLPYAVTKKRTSASLTGVLDTTGVATITTAANFAHLDKTTQTGADQKYQAETAKIAAANLYNTRYPNLVQVTVPKYS